MWASHGGDVAHVPAMWKPGASRGRVAALPHLRAGDLVRLGLVPLVRRFAGLTRAAPNCRSHSLPDSDEGILNG